MSFLLQNVKEMIMNLVEFKSNSVNQMQKIILSGIKEGYKLQLNNYGLTDDMLKLLSEELLSIPYIKSLDISDNNISDRGFNYISEILPELTELEELKVSNDKITYCGMKYLNNRLNKISSLKKLKFDSIIIIFR